MGTRLRVVGAIIAKDLRVFSRDRSFVLLTIVGLLACVLLFWMSQSEADEQLGIGVHIPNAAPAQEQAAGDQSSGFALVPFDSSQALEDAIAARDGVVAGMDFPETFLTDVRTG